jgi:hypothetical protein
MSLRRPPTHRADAPILLILRQDPAWKTDTIEAEIAEARKKAADAIPDNPKDPKDPKVAEARAKAADEAEEAHPVSAYLAGDTRYDLGATRPVGDQQRSPLDYLDGTPTVFHLRRMPGSKWRLAAELLARREGMGDEEHYRRYTEQTWALVRTGVLKITEGVDGEAWALERQGKDPLTEGDMQTIFDLVPGVIDQIGLAIFHASRPLGADEGKL